MTQDLEEEEQVPARGSADSKRRRATEIHNLSERVSDVIDLIIKSIS
jgi:hypothetical protein